MKLSDLTLCLAACLLSICKSSYAAVFSNEWAVHIEGGERVARDLAEKHGFVYITEIMPDFYTYRHHSVSRRSVDASPHHHTNLAQETKVKWLEQQVIKKRVKREKQLTDPKWPRMWYLNRGSGLDMNVQAAWKDGYTGVGVVVSILDDGIEKDHPDLKKNYDAGASYDVNSHDPDPQPRYDYTNENRHGTRCAGEVAAERDNKICSVGVAYDASIGGVRMLDGDVTDAVEAQSLSLNPQHIDIYSASWGPDDDGRTVDGPAPLAKHAFEMGIRNGRGNRGSIFVWASGNGGRDHDSCNCDGYTNSIYTLSISSATENGNVPWYSEACSSTLATTYSSGSGGERQIVTTDLRKGCTETHTGTSASAPLAAGVCALALQANPMMTWRDMQHIVVQTARQSNLIANDWITNGIGRRVSHHFGFGLMDAGAMTSLAKNWTNVPEQHECKMVSKQASRGIPINGVVSISMETDGCDYSPNKVVYLEHVQAYLSLTASRRGQLKVYLTSPMGTKSTLLAERVRDTSTEGFSDWAFMTTHSWGESAAGTWTLEIHNGASSSTLKNWTLVMYGTESVPKSSNQVPNRRPNRPVEGCEKGKFLLNTFCYSACPPGFFPANTSIEAPVNATNQTEFKTILVCEHCALHCMKCSGPGDHECNECVRGFQLTPNATCEVLPTQPVDNSFHGFISSHQDMAFIALALSLCVLAVSVFLFIFGLLQARSHGRFCFASKWEEDYKAGINRANAHVGIGGMETFNGGIADHKNPEFTAQGSPLLEDTDSET